MDRFLYGQLNIFLIIFAALLALLSLHIGYRNFRKGIMHTENPKTTLWTIRGVRGFILFFAMCFFMGGLYFKVDWPLYFGLAFVAEELLETGIMVYAAKKQVKS